MRKIILALALAALAAPAALPAVHVQKQADPFVYVTKYGKKYHRIDCPSLSRSKVLRKGRLSVIIADGYTPCKICHPPVKR